MKWHIEKKSLIHYSLKKGCKLMHPFLLSVFISCIYFELIFKMKSVDNTTIIQLCNNLKYILNYYSNK